MGLSHSLSAAMSGLSAASAAAELVATNLANQRTPGFGVRDLALSSASIGGGVKVVAVQRHSDPVLLGDRRGAQAATAAATGTVHFLSDLEGWLGKPGDAGAWGTRVARLESALLSAAGAPQAEARLTETLDAAKALAGMLRDLTDKVQGARVTADRSIAADVRTLNTTLAQVASLNDSIHRMTTLGQDASALIDQRQALVDSLAPIVPLREIPRDGNRIALYTSGGAALLDGRAAQLSFDPTPAIGPASGPLPGLSLNGKSVPFPGPLDGGRLAAALHTRDSLAPAAQADLDAFVGNLIQRLERADGTRPTGVPGLFSDAGLPFDPAAAPGLAGRITVSAAVDPAQGGAVWRLRAGVNATAPGDPGASELLTAMAHSLRLTGQGPGAPVEAMAADMLSGAATARLSADTESAFHGARLAALEQREAAQGVDTDHEMQDLLLIERAYSANTRVIQAVDRMLATLLEI